MGADMLLPKPLNLDTLLRELLRLQREKSAAPAQTRGRGLGQKNAVRFDVPTG
jgi:hypothetical protein